MSHLNFEKETHANLEKKRIWKNCEFGKIVDLLASQYFLTPTYPLNSMKIVFIQVSLLVLIQMLISDIQSMNLRACKSSFFHQIRHQFRFQIVSTKNCAHLVWLLFLTWSQKSSSATFLSFMAWGNLVVSLALLALALPSQIPVDISTKAVCSAKGLTQPRWSIFNEKRSSPL